MRKVETDLGREKLDLEGLIGKGEMDGPDGFKAQTNNGTAYWKGTGWNKNGFGGWSGNSNFYGYGQEELPADSTRRPGRSNRTGE
ncbi:MAG: hypothetical protein KGL39_05360 [Patescibacteria group bacterium]|nr:hypothetical protein [Patescibacteria group bacterium]